LPLKLISFAGKRNTDNISLAWLTANEVNVKQFVVERSNNGVDFSAIGTVAARNVTTAQSQYAYADKEIAALKNNKQIYYRLKMIDIDGTFSYSNVAVINPSASVTRFSTYPNPVKGSVVYVELKETAQSNLQIRIEDVTGKVYNRYTINRSNTTGAIPVNIKSLANGVYMLTVESATDSFVQQIIVQH
jgi:hypothetical protein